MQGEGGFPLLLPAPCLEMTLVLRAVPQMQGSIGKRSAGLTEVQIDSLEVLFPCTDRRTHAHSVLDMNSQT